MQTTTSPRTIDQPASTFNPLTSGERIHLLDVLRGVALLGVLVMNLPSTAVPEQTLRQQAFGQPGDASYWTHFIANLLFDGKMRALFSLLFGASALLFVTQKDERSGGNIIVADLYHRRMFWLVVFGIIHAHFLFKAYELLYFYGLCGFLLFLVRHASTSRLLAGVVVCVLFLIGVNWWEYSEIRMTREKYRISAGRENQHWPLTSPQKKDKTAWENLLKSRSYHPGKDSVQVAILRGNYATIWVYNHPQAVNAESSTFYALFWDPLGMMLLGMVLLRWGVLTGKTSRRTYALLVLTGYGIGLPLSLLAEKSALSQFRDYGLYLDENPFSWNENTYHLRRLAMVLGHIGLVGVLYSAPWLRWWWQPLAAVGRMALTNYIAQSVFCMLLFYGVGLGLVGRFTLYQVYFFVVGIWVIQLVVSPIWLHYFRFGPLEWVWRSLTYDKRQPLRIR